MIRAICRHIPWGDIGDGMLYMIWGAALVVTIPAAIFAIGFLFGAGFNAAP